MRRGGGETLGHAERNGGEGLIEGHALNILNPVTLLRTPKGFLNSYDIIMYELWRVQEQVSLNVVQLSVA